MINIGLLTVNVVIARVVGWSLEELGNMLILCGVLVLGLGASRLVTRWDRPTSPEAWLSATTKDSSLVEIMGKSRRKYSSDYSFFLMESAGLLCILISFFFFA